MKKIQKNRLVVIIVYFGARPRWLNLFLLSCKENIGIDFLMFTNISIANVANNFRAHPMTLSEFNERASIALELKVTFSKPYKVCDFRPAFGVIFSEFIKGYSHWAHSDVDVVFGDINFFISEYNLLKFDISTTKRYYLAGHFTIYRNNIFINNLFKYSPDYMRIFMDGEHFGFDECCSTWQLLINGVQIEKIPTKVRSMTYVINKLSADKKISSFFRTLCCEQDKFDEFGKILDFDTEMIWENGKIKNIKSEQELMYFHFHFLKHDESFHIPEWNRLPQKIMITRSGFEIS